MTVSKLAKSLTLAMVIVACLAYAVADRYPLVAVVALPVGVAGWWLTERRGIFLLPKWLVNSAVTLAIVWSFYRVIDEGGGNVTVSIFCQFLIVVLLLKLWDRKAARDVAQMQTLSVFLVIGSVLTTNALGLGVLLMAAVFVSIFGVMAFHVSAGVERARLAADAAGGAGPAPEPAGRRGLGTLLRMASGSLAFSLAVSVIVWLLMPRGIGEGDLGSFGMLGAGRRTGFTERVDLRRTGIISESSRTVMELRLENLDGQSVGAEGRTAYLRGAVLDRYNQGTWTKSDRQSSQNMTLQAGKFWEFNPIGASNIVVQKIVVRDAPSGTSPLMAMLDPVSVMTDTESRIARWPGPRTLARDGKSGRFSYVVRSAPPRVVDQRSQLLRTTTAVFLDGQSGEGSEKIRAEAERVLRSVALDPDPRTRPPAWDSEVCRALERHLQEHYSYTLDPNPLPRGADPIEVFLFQTRTGHCEYFASALAAMLQSVGIHARVIAGYVAAEFNPEEELYTVRESNAHAWVEAMVAPGLWMTFDPTPPEGLRQQLTPPNRLVAGWRQWLDSLDDVWSRSVVTFDESSRKRLLGVDTNPTPWLQERLAGLIADLRSGGRDKIGRAIGLVGLVLVAGAFLGVLGVRLWRAGRSRWRERRERERFARELADLGVPAEHSRWYTAALAALQRLGLGKPAWRPPLEHADALGETGGDALRAAAPFRETASAYYTLRFAQRELTGPDADRARRALAELEAAGPGRAESTDPA